MDYNRIDPGEAVEFEVFLFDGQQARVGKTVELSIQRATDGEYWNGSGWQAGYVTVTMTERTGNVSLEGEYFYPFTSEEILDTYSGSVKYVEGGYETYFKEEFKVVDWLDRDLAVGPESAGRRVRDSLRPLRNRVVTAGNTMTVYKEDDATPAFTGTLNTDPLADPIVEVDPT